jgi:MoxR-like ATPase
MDRNKLEDPATSRVEISTLSEDEKVLVTRLEEATDALWANKKEVDYAYEKIEEYLPTRKVEHINYDGETVNWEVALNWEEIKALQEGGKLLEKAEEITRKKLAENFSGDKLESKVRNVRRKIVSLIKKGLAKYDELSQKDNLEARLKNYSEAKTEEEREKIWSQIPPEMKMLTKYRRFRLKELVHGKKELEKKDNEGRCMLADLDDAREDGNVEAVSEIENVEYKKLHKEYKEILFSSPEIYYWKKITQLKEMKETLDGEGGIVETPYVKEVMEMIDADIRNGRSVFVHGELGSGKTELVKHICHKTYSQKHLERWEKENPKPKYPGEIDDWTARREKERVPFIISGHKNMDIAPLLGSRGMEVSEKPSPEEQARIIEEAVKKFESDEGEVGKKATDAQKESLRKAYQEGFKNFVEVKAVLGQFYEAMRQGRPIIIDEINAIPHSILIALNDLLQAKPGDTIIPMIPGAESFVVAEGFAVLATGNWKPEDGKAYIGRQPIDAAFLSRFGITSYDYLPQRIEGETLGTTDESTRNEKAESELFMLMATHILDSDTLGANIPVGTFEKLRGLAKAARVLQNAFSEKGNIIFNDPETGTNLPAKEVMGENVLSMRHLIPILENWKNDGFTRDLDDYVFLHFVDRSSGARPMEKKFVYQTIQTISDKQIFSQEKWPDAFSKDGLGKVDNYPIRKKMYGIDNDTQLRSPISEKIEKVFHSPQQVVEEIFGEAPNRKMIDRRLFEQDESGEDKPDQSAEDLEKERKYFAMLQGLEEIAKQMSGEEYDMTEEEKTIFADLQKMTQKI